jgi:hypothetical protein
MPFVMLALAGSPISLTNRLALGRAPKIWAASPITVAFSGSEFGPTVDTRQSGLEQRYLALFANVSTVFLLKSGAAISTHSVKFFLPFRATALGRLATCLSSAKNGGFITIPKGRIPALGIDRQHQKQYRFQTQL